MQNPVYEQFLSDQHIEWRYLTSVPIDQFIIEDDNVGRLLRPSITITDNKGRWNEAIVDRYATAMKRGDDFPAVIAYRSGDDFKLITGYHRILAARKAERPSFDCYEVITDSVTVIRRLTRSANTIEGQGTSTDEAILQAIAIVREEHITAAEAARMMAVSETSVTTILRADDVRHRLVSMNYQTALANGPVANLGEIQSNAVLLEAARLADRARLTGDEIRHLRQDIVGKRSERDQLDVVSTWRKRPDIAGRINPSTAPTRAIVSGTTKQATQKRTILFRTLTTLDHTIGTHPTSINLGLDTAQTRIAFFNQWRALDAKITKMAAMHSDGGA